VPKHGLMIRIIVAMVVIATIVAISLAVTRPPPATSGWKSNYAVEPGFTVTIDARGFRFPTSIAFIPNPGDSPKDPLYFVTELRGKIKVVTNDRSVFTFAEDFFTVRPKKGEVRIIDQSVGMAGICLAPDLGYVFVTFSYHDSDNTLRNNIVRFQTNPGTFALSPTSQIDFTQVFSAHPSAPAHQIGGCQSKDEHLYVSVGDAFQTEQSQRMDSLLGKVLRMTLDGRPVPDNPFYRDDDIANAQNYIWASGLRNPFGLKIVGDQVFVADNGADIDRFLQVKKGGNYLWDGTNASIGTNADAVFYPGRGVAQLDYYPPDANIFPNRFKDNLFMTMTGNAATLREGFPAIWAIPYDFPQDKLAAVTRPLLRYRGQQNQVIVGLGFGPDGLYFSLLAPDDSGTSQVLKISFAPAANYPFILGEELNPVVLINTRGCLACHSLADSQTGGVGPNLDRNTLVPRLEERLNSEAYIRTVQEVDQLDLEPFTSYRNARHSIVRAQGTEKIRLWLYNRILEPKFDDPDAAMPRQGLSSPQAKAVADYLAGVSEDAAAAVEDRGAIRKVKDVVNKIVRPVENRLPYPTRENAKQFLAAMFAFGFVMGTLVLGLSFWLLANRRRKRHRGSFK